MKIAKKIISLVTIFAVLISCFTPVTKVEAISYGDGKNLIKVGIENNLGFDVDAKVNNINWKNDNDEYHTTDNKYNIVINVTKTKTSGTKIPTLLYGGNWNINKTVSEENGKYTFTLSLDNTGNESTYLDIKIIEDNTNTNNNNQNENNNNDNNQQQTQFDGKAVVVWSCNNTICYHEFTNLKSNEVNYIKASEVKDDKDQTKAFDVHARTKFFAVKAEFDKRKAEIDANKVSIEDLKGPDGIDYMPVNEPDENNALVAYGNREFKAIIYGEDFKGVSIGSLDELDYYPSEWTDWFLRRETYDMGGTAKDNPVEIDTVLLQKKINLKLQTNLNNYTVTKIEALDVPKEAVKITKKNDGSYDFEFASNYYDKVIFKITTSDNKEQYIYINRRTTDPWIRTDNGKEGIVVETFYDRNKTYKDLDVIAKIVYKDGTSKIVHLNAEKGIDDGLGNLVDDYEVDEQTKGNQNEPKGKGMKRANFVYSMSKSELKKVSKIYINVEYKGSTSTTFVGNFAGSGKGDVIDMKYWEDRLN